MSNNYLVHHGVKGMKWGVRRYQDKNRRRRERLRPGDIILKAGTEIQNIHANAYEEGRSFFGSFTKNDKEHYKNYYKNIVPGQSKRTHLYKNTMTTTEDIKLAGNDALREAIRKTDPKGGFVKTKKGWKYKDNAGAQGSLIKAVMPKDFYGINAYTNMPKRKKKKVERYLRKHGNYGGLYDSNDHRLTGADAPAVYFGDNKFKKIKSVQSKNIGNEKVPYAKIFVKASGVAVKDAFKTIRKHSFPGYTVTHAILNRL